jgi:hypothetical protein
MNTVRWGLSIALLGFLSLGNRPSPARGQVEEGTIDLKTVNLDGLKDLIKQQKGKVVVVDFWADT